jgi:hypothetical protein
LALRAGLDLGIFTRLGAVAMTADTLGAALKVEPVRLSRLLYALASIGLLEVKDGQFRNGSEASTFLDGDLPTAGVDFHVPFSGRKGSSHGSREQGKFANEFYTTVKTANTLA